MADKRDQWADTFSAEPAGGWLSGVLADEDGFDRRTLWRLGFWGVGAVAAVVVAILAGQTSAQLRREQVASADILARQSQQIQFVAKETQNEAKRLSQAIDTLNSDRDRLYTRVTSVEQGLESMTGSIRRQVVAAASAIVPPAPVPPTPAPSAAPVSSEAVQTPAVAPLPSITPPAPVAMVEAAPVKPNLPPQQTPTAPLMLSKSIMGPPDVAPTKLVEPPAPEPVIAAPEVTASIPAARSDPVVAETVAVPVQRTEFGIDLGGANSVDGLRALWRGMVKSHKALDGLRPIIMVKERTTGMGMQLRLVAGPLGDAATAAKLCAALTESSRSCETSVFDGQRLALRNDAPVAVPTPAPPVQRKRSSRTISRTELPPPKPVEEPAPAPAPQSSLSSFLAR